MDERDQQARDREAQEENQTEQMTHKRIYKNGLMYHRYRFSLWGNIKVWFCRRFGHQLNNDKNYEWCERCGLVHEEIYHKQNR